ncbi:MAG: ribbon-helix-helix protein, CopG family [Candidatus Bathyarchaeia archaeon]
MPKTQITITVDQILIERLDEERKELGLSRSAYIELILRRRPQRLIGEHY